MHRLKNNAALYRVWLILRGVGNAGGGKTFAPQATRIAQAAGAPEIVGLVARYGKSVVDAKCCAAPNDVGFR
jgi:hypothetical protein